MVDFNKLSKISKASGEIVAKEHPEYDQHFSHVFQLGFQGGYCFAEKYPDYDTNNLDKVAEINMKQANPYYTEEEKKAYILGYKRGFSYVINFSESLTKAARCAIFERLEQPILHGRLTDMQLNVLLNYRNLFPEKSEKEIFDGLLKDMKKEFERKMVGKASIDDLKDEFEDLYYGVRREESTGEGIKR